MPQHRQNPSGADPQWSIADWIGHTFHHAAAKSYERLVDHIAPVELLGLTATPERADGLSLLHHFDGRVFSVDLFNEGAMELDGVASDIVLCSIRESVPSRRTAEVDELRNPASFQDELGSDLPDVYDCSS